MTAFSEKGVFLCECHGRVSQALPMDAIRQSLEQRKPGLRVVVGDNFCQPEVLPRLVQEHGLEPMVIGACWQLGSKLGFPEEPEKAAVDPYSVGIVDLLREADSPRDSAASVDRVKLLLWAQVARQARSSSVPQRALKLHFTRPQGEISRRELFGALLPQYQVIPYVQAERCVGGAGCNLCQESCDRNAIAVDGKEVSIDKLRCQGCGTCVALCPCQAISYPTFSLDQLHAEMEGLLLSDGEILEPRVIAITCQSCGPSSGGSEINPFGYAPNVLPLEVPCLAMAAPWLMLCAFDLGTQGLAIISNKKMCRLGLNCDQWQGRVRFVQDLLELWGIEPERIQAFDADNLEQKLAQFARGLSRLRPTLLRSCQPTAVPGNGLPLPSLIAAMTQKLAPASGGRISVGSVPFGKLELDGSQCTACGLCALHCPTEALHFLSGGDSFQLLFEHQSCVGCGQCVRICPEACLQLENVLEVGKLNSPAEAILEGEIARCRECGGPIAPRAMIEKLRSRLDAAGVITSQLEVCPACRTKALSDGADRMMGA
ncbi:MAG: 4Fe-4S binding protein [Dehalococcoidia bacterium]|nr:4Fe-4S binding protein [Dehalococcoidia bacterium]